jgi:3',5'-cyclic AMP phosphodiesterase CpdA
MLIAVVADSHLSPRAPECVENWQAARRAIARHDPDLTVHLGDITLDGENHPEELSFAASCFADWPTPMRCVPGNHDMGNGSGEEPIDAGRLSAYEAVFGPDRWHVVAGEWHLFGIDAQLLGGATAQENEHWSWLEEQVSALDPHAQSVLFVHRPVVRPVASESARSGRYVVDAARDRLLEGPLRLSLRLVLSGHTHQHLDLQASGVRHVWVPSCAFVLPDDMQVRVGEKVVGIGLLELTERRARFDLLCPDGMRRHELPRLTFYSKTKTLPNK